MQFWVKEVTKEGAALYEEQSVDLCESKDQKAGSISGFREPLGSADNGCYEAAYSHAFLTCPTRHH